ncbi:hypothetical protein MPL3356_80280 [Mesorhizobium plurifarium]|uniref:Uncharacterized protein n=1 Tax=Mesorhizobium plurifarium TaxID=69974 RepID=A0A090G8C9_MESPL|nr:hypothetical protein MPL3356_80280 [Mesorhizobium plurifarium]CDX43745.1 hypothetical protein MPLDJ20_60352 [Mesorhizobium plurifarium]CDX53049.1 hypothetical protein MPL1032_160159 [Mesorhizobium plurifarium]CDX54683.1 hypothetical protein MPL3365_20120 [Mesorhizobium plurifarium]
MGNKALKIFAGGNHSFTGIVNHTGEDLRPGKNSGSRRKPGPASLWSHLGWLINVVH